MTGSITLADIQYAYGKVSKVAHKTPLDYSRTFSEIAGCDIYLKLENLQKTGSFKFRGAYNKTQSLTQEEKVRGVIAASAGNHAQGTAYAAGIAGIKATIVMPEVAPLAKIMATRGYGAEVVLSGTVYDDAYQKALEIQKESGQTFVHAFNDGAVIAGQGTVGLEILEELDDIAAIVVPVGGGGLISGIAIAVKAIAPHIKIYGVQAQGASAMYMSKLEHVIRTTPDAVTMADGIAVKVPGDLTFAIIDKYVDEIVVVDDEATASAILMMLERAKLVVEGAGAVSLAAVLNGKINAKGKIVCVVSGGNIDVNFISRIIERGLVKAGRHIRISSTIIDRPGALQRILAVIARLQANVIHVYQDRAARNIAIGHTAVEISLEARDIMHAEEIVAGLRAEGYIIEII